MKNPILLTITAFIWGTALVAQSISTNYMGAFTFNGIRFFIGGLVLLPLIFFMSKSKNQVDSGSQSINSKNLLLKGGIYCGLVIFMGAAFQQIGIAGSTAGKAGFITALYILIVPLLGLLFGRKVSALIWFCLAIAIIGMYLLCINEDLILSSGDAYMLLCTFFFAAHILIIDYYSPKVDGVKLSCIQFFTCSFLSIICALLFEEINLHSIKKALIPLLYVGVLSCGIAYTLQIIGQRNFNPTIASLILSLESVFAVLAGWIILNETLTQKEIIGCLLIFAATLIAQSPRLFKTKANP